MNSRLEKYRSGNRQQGAAIVEMAIVVLVFLVLVFGIIEFALMIFHWSLLDEATRAGARYAIVNDPACSIYEETNDVNYKCTGGPLDCSTDPDDQKIVTVNGDCTVGEPYTLIDAGCKIVERMRATQSLINSPEAGVAVVITYACTDAGFAGLTQKVPTVTIEANNVPYYFSVPGMFGLGPSVNMPSFATTRTGEDLETVN